MPCQLTLREVSVHVKRRAFAFAVCQAWRLSLGNGFRLLYGVRGK